MEGSQGLALLYQYASECQLCHFEQLFSELYAVLSVEERWEAAVLRAQIRLYATDPTAPDDLEKIGPPVNPPRFPPLNTQWKLDAPNRFIVIPKAPGALQRFVRSLPRVQERFAQWYGEQGSILLRQIQGEIHYFMGDVRTALAFAEEQGRAEFHNEADALMALILKFRCCLASGQPRRAETCMLDIIRLSKAHPECVAAYESFRGWASATTSWNGDSPRFAEDPAGNHSPVLDDRLEYIRHGSSQSTPLESPLIEYAERSYEGAYRLRQCYMDLFHAMHWMVIGDRRQAEVYFLKAYEVARASNVIMPIVESGEQVTPLLRHIKSSCVDCSRQWVDDIIARVEEYEACINQYRSFNA